MRIWEFTVRRWQFTLLVFGFAIAMGVSSWRSIPRSEDPIFPIPIVTVIAVYPGADPIDVERLIVDPIEDAINELDDVKEIESESRDGLGVVTVEFSWDTDPGGEVRRGGTRDQRAALRAARGARVARHPQGLAGLVNTCRSRSSARARATRARVARRGLRELLETVPGVREAESWAYPKPEVGVAIDLERLARRA